MGAWNLDVGGTFYDVEFLDGSCESLFSDCNALHDFAFSTQNLARSAADALMNQVLVDGGAGLFDSEPDLTNGCESINCLLLTPYAFVPRSYSIYAANAYNDNGNLDSADDRFTYDRRDYTTLAPDFTYAVWSEAAVVPEPGTALLVG
jgi:hypothetical protein